MDVTRRIGTYKVLLLDRQMQADSGRAGFVYFYAPSGAYLGYVCGIRDGTPLPQTVAHANGIVHIHVRETEMRALIGMLQDEAAVVLNYDTDRGRGTVSPAAMSSGAPDAEPTDRAGGAERARARA